MQKLQKSKSATTDYAVRSTQVAFKRDSAPTRYNLCVLSSSIRVIEEMTVYLSCSSVRQRLAASHINFGFFK